MSWSIGYDPAWNRDIGYGVPAYCDHPECHEQIDRGLSYVCGGSPYGEPNGCGLYFCGQHRETVWDDDNDDIMQANGEELRQVCERCAQHHRTGEDVDPFDAKPDHPKWVAWKLTDDSWAEWRAENRETVEALRIQVVSE